MDFDHLKSFAAAMKSVQSRVDRHTSPPLTPGAPPKNDPAQPPGSPPPAPPPPNNPFQSVAAKLGTGLATGATAVDDVPVRVSRDEAILNPKQIDMLGRGRVMDTLSSTGGQPISAGKGYQGGGGPGGGGPGGGGVDPISMAIEATKQGLKERFDNTIATGKEFAAAATSQRAGELGGHALRGVGSGAKAMLGEHDPFAKVIDGVTKFGAIMFEATDKLRDWSKQLHDSNIKFAQYSGPMAAVDIRQQVRDINLSRERGSRRAETAETLAEGKHKLEKEFAPIEDAIANLQNIITAWIDNQLADFLVVVKEAAKKYLNIDLDAMKNNDDMTKWMDEIANDDEKFDAQGRPKRF